MAGQVRFPRMPRKKGAGGGNQQAEQAIKADFSQRLTSRRKERGHTQETIAAKLGVPDKTYATWEQGKNFPRTMALFLGLCSELDVTTDYMLAARPPSDSGIEGLARELADRLGQHRIQELLRHPKATVRREIDLLSGSLRDPRRTPVH